MEWQANSLQFPFVGNAVGAKDAVRPPKAREALCARRRREKALCARVLTGGPRKALCAARGTARLPRARIWEGYRELVSSTFSRLSRQRANTPAETARFQSTTGTLRYLDGSLPQSDADNDWWNMVYHWDDCPVLAGLDLGDYTSDAVQNDSGSSQELLSHYYIGIRGAWTKDADDLLSGGEALWQALTAVAVSTVTKEG